MKGRIFVSLIIFAVFIGAWAVPPLEAQGHFEFGAHYSRWSRAEGEPAPTSWASTTGFWAAAHGSRSTSATWKLRRSARGRKKQDCCMSRSPARSSTSLFSA